jgi:hypothetical protein
MKLYRLFCISGLKAGDLGRSLPSGDGLLGGVEVGSGILMMSELMYSLFQSDLRKLILKCADVKFSVCVDVNNFNGHIEVQKLLLVVEIANILLFLRLMLNEVDYW